MIQRVCGLLLLVSIVTGCGLFQSDIAPDRLVGQTVIITLESGAFS